MKGGTNRTLEGHPLPSSAHTPPHGTFPSDAFMHLNLLPFPVPSLHRLALHCSRAVPGVPALLGLGRAPPGGGFYGRVWKSDIVLVYMGRAG